MADSIRDTPGLTKHIDDLKTRLIKHFTALVGHASPDRTDRTLTAITQYQMQVETTEIVRAAEELQTLIRQLQEMWLFGQLNTVGESGAQQRTDENAKAVAHLLKQLLERQQQSDPDAPPEANGNAEHQPESNGIAEDAT